MIEKTTSGHNILLTLKVQDIANSLTLKVQTNLNSLTVKVQDI